MWLDGSCPKVFRTMKKISLDFGHLRGWVGVFDRIWKIPDFLPLRTYRKSIFFGFFTVLWGDLEGAGTLSPPPELKLQGVQ